MDKRTTNLVLFEMSEGMAMSILYRADRNRELWRIRTARAVIRGGMFTIEHPSQEKSSQETNNVQTKIYLIGLSFNEQLLHWHNQR